MRPQDALPLACWVSKGGEAEVLEVHDRPEEWVPGEGSPEKILGDPENFHPMSSLARG